MSENVANHAAVLQNGGPNRPAPPAEPVRTLLPASETTRKPEPEAAETGSAKEEEGRDYDLDTVFAKLKSLKGDGDDAGNDNS